MLVNRREHVRHLEQYGFFLQREGRNHSIYNNGRGKMVPVKRHTTFDRITANALCRQAGVLAVF
ncbi:type II toxin-antitoxin system HicA family toxin [uncultured Fretibacterium sp.]|mgnify:FL=1|uniref:type II toxin-antitoxin system HicA family toxin n=1 Tax=uncultured Fretibacterium sp. TaxID=1678694 RepID=UPI0026128A73|nr:type II toxin-antitoxin system HicA family toxin [uncultured Fretibacterium sp.]